MHQETNSASIDDQAWWRTGVVYQVYIRSFADGNGDGTGDLAGLRRRLPYLRDLGVDGIWLNPWYRSPLHDGGYDVADYRDIEPRYGTMAEAETLIAEAHDHGLKVVIDLVPNHTSSQHAWFQEALTSPPGSPARDRYHIVPGGGDGSEPPNDWTSVFGGPGWSRLDDGEWYLHIFDTTQPDLNWTNPEVIDEFKSIFRFWLDRDVDGFRVDVAHGLAKDMDYPDVGGDGEEILRSAMTKDHPYWDRDEIHPIVRGWRAVLDEHPGTMMVAEAWVATERLPLYVRPDEYHQSFNFDFLAAEWDAEEMKQVLSESIAATHAVGAAPTWVLSNHDVVRHATRYGLPVGTDWRAWLLEGPHDILDLDLGLARARAGTLLMLALPGGVYLYQGEELGLHEVWDLPLDVLDDPVWEQSGHERKGRDGCRVPMPWTTDGPSLGFGDGEGWLPQPEAFAEKSVEAQEGVVGSTLEMYRQALAERTRHFTADEAVEWLDAPRGVIGLRRGSGVECWVNISGRPMPLDPTREVILTSGPLSEAAGAGSPNTALLPVDTAVWLI